MEELNDDTGVLDKLCYGCGATLQSRDADAPGYVPAKRGEEGAILCKRCYRIRHYNDLAPVAVSRDDFLQILDGIGKTRSLVLHIIDLIDFEGSLMTSLPRFVGDNPLVVVLNKIDLLGDVNPNKFVNWTRRQLKMNGLKASDVVPVSAKTNVGLERLASRMEQLRQGKDVYVVGATNTGKSTLINRLIQSYSDLNLELTTSRYPGTTLDVIRIPLTDGSDLVDTPGIVYENRLSERVAAKDMRLLLPEDLLRPRIYQLNAGQTIFVGGLARLDFVQGERQSFTFYVANPLRLHRTKLERADDFYNKHKGNLLVPPHKEEIDRWPPWTRHSFRIPPDTANDISISGLGWIKVNGKQGAQLDVHVPQGTKVSLRESLL